MVVAVAEGGLYLIYTNRSKSSVASSTSKSAKRKLHGPIVSLEIPKHDILLGSEAAISNAEPLSIILDGEQPEADSSVRRRIPTTKVPTDPAL